MRVLIFHGYLLRGTGSNVYNASLAPALAALGHEVHLLCQDRGAAELGWVDAVGDWATGELAVRGAVPSEDHDSGAFARPGPPAAEQAPGAGSVTVYTPEIGGLLPVYVRDEYPAFEVREFAELSEEELARYLAANVAAVRGVVRRAGGIEAALANHLVMGPVILARAGLPFAAKVHGSALEYTVKRDPDRFLPYAREGLGAASGVLVGSRHTAESLWRAFDDPALEAKTRLGPPGVDTRLFAPIEGEQRPARLRAFVADLLADDGGAPAGEAGAQGREPAGGGNSHEAGEAAGAGAWGRDPARARRAVERWAEAEADRVIFVGKLIVSKGIDLLLAAWPLAHAAKPGSRLLVVGFGEYRAAAERLWEALAAGDLPAAAEIAAAGRELEGGPREPLSHLSAFLRQLPEGYADTARAAAGSVDFAGRLEHDEVARIVPAADALVFPSTFPEAFGMVAAEAAAAGVLPVSAAHSGALEVSFTLAAALPAETASLLSFPLGDDVVSAIAERLRAWLTLSPTEREPTRRALIATAGGLYGWEGVARGVLDAAAGRLDALAPVPGGD